MSRSVRKRHASHGAGLGLGAIACLAGAAVAVNGAVRNAPAVLRGAQDVLEAATIGAAVLTAVTVLVVIMWAALRLGGARQRQDEARGLPGHGQRQDQAPGLSDPALSVPEPEPALSVPEPEPALTVPEPEPTVGPVPERLPGRPLFINGPVSRVPATRPEGTRAARSPRV
jgi:hypothetical protein